MLRVNFKTLLAENKKFSGVHVTATYKIRGGSRRKGRV